MITDERKQSIGANEKSPGEITSIDDIADVGDQTHNTNRVRYLTQEEAAGIAMEVWNTAEQAASENIKDYVPEWVPVVLQWKVEQLFPRSKRMQESAKKCILEHL